MDKQDVVYTYNGTLFSLKKEANSDICYSLEENLEDIMLSEINQSQEDKCCIDLLIWDI